MLPDRLRQGRPQGRVRQGHRGHQVTRFVAPLPREEARNHREWATRPQIDVVDNHPDLDRDHQGKQVVQPEAPEVGPVLETLGQDEHTGEHEEGGDAEPADGVEARECHVLGKKVRAHAIDEIGRMA